MKFRNCLKSTVGLVALVVAGPAWAADVLPPPAPSVQVADHSSGSCLYGRIDVGGSLYERPNLSVGGGGIDDTGLVEIGIGCQLLESFRIEAALGTRIPQDLHGPLEAEIHSSSVFLNFTYDITNYAGWTPYIGGGVGGAFHMISDVTQPINSSDGEEADFAWNLHFGVSYDFTPQSKIDFGYRLSDLGKVRTGGPNEIIVDDLVAHEFTVGYRFQFGTW